MSSKPTPGPVTVCHTLVSNEVRGFSITAAPHGSCDPICSSDFRSERSSSEIKANALLIKEAFDAATETGLTPQQLRERMERAEKQRDELLTALKAIVAIEAVPFDFPADWDAQIAGCSECQRYKDHPIQKGICDNHRKPLYARKRHEDDQQATLIYRAKDAARAAIASVEAAS